MIFVLSPAKALDYESPLATPRFTQPEYLDDAAELITALRELSHAQVAELMHLSDTLAALNVARYAEWSQPFSPANARPAVLAFNGDVYDGLDARSLTEAQLDYAQAHLRILSGLYGLLRPLDLTQPFRDGGQHDAARLVDVSRFQIKPQHVLRKRFAPIVSHVAPDQFALHRRFRKRPA